MEKRERFIVENLNGFSIMFKKTIPQRSGKLFLKRLIDIVVSAFCILLFLPLWVIIPLLIKRDSPGPAFFCQERIGKNGKRFTMYKFRSMVVGAEQMQEKLTHLNERDGPVFKIENDPRHTRFGKFLRQTSLDEIPQVFNVLKGDMSLVGPRPPLYKEVLQYSPWQRKRLSIILGVTCLWQVTGRDKITFDEWMKLDLQYIKNWSLSLDFKIIMKTLVAVLSRINKNAEDKKSIIKNLFSFGKDEAYAEAMHYYNKHLYRESIEKFQQILKKNHSHKSLYHIIAHFYCGQAYYNLGVILFVMGNYSAAIEQFQKALYISELHVDGYHFIGVCQNNLGDFESAVKTFNTILEIDSSHLYTKLKLGTTLHNLKIWDKTADIYNSILQTNSSFADVHYRLGLAYLGQKKVNQAINSFQNALHINPDYIEALVKLGICQAYLGNFGDAVNTFSVIIDKFPNYADIYYYLGIIYTCSNEIEKAVRAFKKTLDINPMYKDAKIKLGILYYSLEEFGEGLKQLKEASNLDPDNSNLTVSISEIEDIINSSNESNSKLLDVFGLIFGGDKIITETIQEFNKHIIISPDFSDIISMIKNFSENDTKYCELLIPIIKDYVHQNPTYPDIHNTLGTLYLKIHKIEDAEASFRQALCLNPNYLQARINLFKSLKDLGKLQEALHHGKNILAKGIPYPDVYYDVGSVCLSLHQYEEAEFFTRKALQLNPSYGAAYFLMAQIQGGKGNIREALYGLKKCLATNTPEEFHEKATRMLYEYQSIKV